jgi:hypothetical protein
MTRKKGSQEPKNSRRRTLLKMGVLGLGMPFLRAVPALQKDEESAGSYVILEWYEPAELTS